MTAAVWVADWRNLVGILVPAAVGVCIFAYLVRCARRDDAARRADHDRRWEALRTELEARRRTSGWYESQAYFDAECECIRIAEEWRSRRRHPAARPRP